MLASYLTTLKSTSNSTFFSANRQSRWHLVAFGMLGSSVSGISLVAVPAMVQGSGFTYLQMCIGFIFGYILVAKVLLPIYYRSNTISIYSYLEQRFGKNSHKTGSWFFIISKIITSASKLYVAVFVLHQFLFSNMNVPIWITVTVAIFMIWIYTFRGGIKTIVVTDALQSLVLFVVIIMMIINTLNLMNFSPFEAIKLLHSSNLTNTFIFSDFLTTQNFFKQFFSGIFIVIVMTGLSQDMMQTTLSCRSLRDAQKNMIWYGIGFVPLNLLLLSLGALLLIFSNNFGIILPQNPNGIVPMFCAEYFSPVVCLLFILGIIAAAFNSADSSLTSIATIFFVDILKNNTDSNTSVKLRKVVYLCVCIVEIFVVLLFDNVRDKSLLDTIYTIVGYAYGPLLGLFAFGFFTKFQVRDKLIPLAALISPALTFGISHFCKVKINYSFGYEILIINGLLMFLMMMMCIRKTDKR
jgi:Na+/proline symporter